MTPNVAFKYTGATPGADTTERDLFNSVTAFGYNGVASPGALQRAGIKRLLLMLNASGAVNVKFYFSTDGGITWVEDSFFATALPAGANQRDFPCEQVSQWDCKITAANAVAAAQTSYNVTISGLSDRSLAQ